MKRSSWRLRAVRSPGISSVLMCIFCLPHPAPPRYFENVRQAVLWRVTRLSNDELSGEEEAVMSVVHSLMSLLEVIQPNSNVSKVIVHLLHMRYYINTNACGYYCSMNSYPTKPTPFFKMRSGICLWGCRGASTDLVVALSCCAVRQSHALPFCPCCCIFPRTVCPFLCQLYKQWRRVRHFYPLLPLPVLHCT